MTVLRPVITLTSDFGLADPYVGSMKGVILSLNPDVLIVDISHEVRPQCIEQGAFLLAAAWPYFPPGSIHVAVVDPGVGTERRAIALVTESGTFLGPDNGLLSVALPEDARQAAGDSTRMAPLPGRARGFLLADARFHRRPVSATFHGRDIFASVAAHLSLGIPAADLGPEVREIITLPPFRAHSRPDGSLEGRVIHVDRFGNLITTVRRDQLGAQQIVVELAGRRVSGLVQTYAQAQGLAALVGSAGYMEIALAGGSAAQELRADVGATLIVRTL